MRYALKKDLIGVFLALLFLASSGLFWEVRPLAFLDHVQSGSGIKVFTANAPLWYIGQDDAYGQFLKNQNADIYQLQEMIPPTSTAEPKTEFLKKYFPDYTIVAHHELVTLTRLPVVAEEYKEGNHFQRVRIKIKGTDVDFFNVHMPIHLIPWMARSPLDFLSDMKERFALRSGQFEKLYVAVSQSPNAYVSGDFNTSRMMGMMRPLLSITEDSFTASGLYFPVTWDEQKHLWWRIDYSLVKMLKLLSHKTINQGEYSDHAAVLVEISL